MKRKYDTGKKGCTKSKQWKGIAESAVVANKKRQKEDRRHQAAVAGEDKSHFDIGREIAGFDHHRGGGTGENAKQQ